MPQIITINTPGRSLTDITDEIAHVVADAPANSGVAHILVQHTSASLVIQENADDDVQRDLISYFDRIAPEDGPYLHSAEGPDDMPAHLKSALTTTSLSIPFVDGKMLLGVWQGIYLFEHRRAAHSRRIIVSLTAEL